jgi:hypothetical protein
MKRNVGESQTQNFGEVIVAACEFDSDVAPDATAMERAALHLERVLVRGSNARIAAALAELAAELAPAAAGCGNPWTFGPILQTA